MANQFLLHLAAFLPLGPEVTISHKKGKCFLCPGGEAQRGRQQGCWARSHWSGCSAVQMLRAASGPAGSCCTPGPGCNPPGVLDSCWPHLSLLHSATDGQASFFLHIYVCVCVCVRTCIYTQIDITLIWIEEIHDVSWFVLPKCIKLKSVL